MLFFFGNNRQDQDDIRSQFEKDFGKDADQGRCIFFGRSAYFDKHGNRLDDDEDDE